MCPKILVLLSVLIFFCTKVTCKKYDNYTLYRGLPVSEDHLGFFRNLTETEYSINFWRPPSTVNRPIEFVIPPEIKENFLREATKRDIYLTTVIPDLQRAFDNQRITSYIRRNMASFDWQSYFRLKDIYGWLKDLRKSHPDIMTLLPIGRTEESRTIYAVRILHKGSKKRSRVLVEGGIHAREWISTAFVTYMISEILFAPMRKNNTNLIEIAMTYDFFFVPLLNPDGYEYSHTEDRLWRKNRSPPHGVDINRNFGYGFGSVGVSSSPSSEIYCGRRPFSEKESQAMQTFVKSLSPSLEYYLGFHAYGQFMIIPYAHSKAHTENYNEVENMGLTAAKKLSRRYNTRYTVGTAYDTVGYQTSGVSGCWAKKTHRIPFVITTELRDNGQYGFALPARHIIPTCMETMDGITAFLKPLKTPFKKLSGDGGIIPSKHDEFETNDQKNNILDLFILVSNVLFFIIVRFD